MKSNVCSQQRLQLSSIREEQTMNNNPNSLSSIANASRLKQNNLHHRVKFEKSRLKLGRGGGGNIWLGRISYNDLLHHHRCLHHLDRKMSATITASSSEADQSSDTIAGKRKGDNIKYENDDHVMLIAVKQDYRARRHLNNTSNTSNVAPIEEGEHVLLSTLPPHDHVISMLGWTQKSHGPVYMALELMDSDLGAELSCKNYPRNEETVRYMLYVILSALEHLHRHNIAHRDIKPSNLLLKFDEKTESTKAVLSDFGAAHYAIECPHRAAVKIRGTPFYQAPEVLLGKVEAQTSTACDIWSAGCTMYDMFSRGKTAFWHEGPPSSLRVIAEISKKLGTDFAMKKTEGKPHTLLDDIGKRLTPQMKELLLLMIEPDWTKRPTAAQLLDHPFFDKIKEENTMLSYRNETSDKKTFVTLSKSLYTLKFNGGGGSSKRYIGAGNLDFHSVYSDKPFATSRFLTSKIRTEENVPGLFELDTFNGSETYQKDFTTKSETGGDIELLDTAEKGKISDGRLCPINSSGVCGLFSDDDDKHNENKEHNCTIAKRTLFPQLPSGSRISDNDQHAMSFSEALDNSIEDSDITSSLSNTGVKGPFSGSRHISLELNNSHCSQSRLQNQSDISMGSSIHLSMHRNFFNANHHHSGSSSNTHGTPIIIHGHNAAVIGHSQRSGDYNAPLGTLLPNCSTTRGTNDQNTTNYQNHHDPSHSNRLLNVKVTCGDISYSGGVHCSTCEQLCFSSDSSIQTGDKSEDTSILSTSVTQENRISSRTKNDLSEIGSYESSTPHLRTNSSRVLYMSVMENGFAKTSSEHSVSPLQPLETPSPVFSHNPFSSPEKDDCFQNTINRRVFSPSYALVSSEFCSTLPHSDDNPVLCNSAMKGRERDKIRTPFVTFKEADIVMKDELPDFHCEGEEKRHQESGHSSSLLHFTWNPNSILTNNSDRIVENWDTNCHLGNEYDIIKDKLDNWAANNILDSSCLSVTSVASSIPLPSALRGRQEVDTSTAADVYMTNDCGTALAGEEDQDDDIGVTTSGDTKNVRYDASRAAAAFSRALGSRNSRRLINNLCSPSESLQAFVVPSLSSVTITNNRTTDIFCSNYETQPISEKYNLPYIGSDISQQCPPSHLQSKGDDLSLSLTQCPVEMNVSLSTTRKQLSFDDSPFSTSKKTEKKSTISLINCSTESNNRLQNDGGFSSHVRQDQRCIVFPPSMSLFNKVRIAYADENDVLLSQTPFSQRSSYSTPPEIRSAKSPTVQQISHLRTSPRFLNVNINNSGGILHRKNSSSGVSSWEKSSVSGTTSTVMFLANRSSEVVTGGVSNQCLYSKDSPSDKFSPAKAVTFLDRHLTPISNGNKHIVASQNLYHECDRSHLHVDLESKIMNCEGLIDIAVKRNTIDSENLLSETFLSADKIHPVTGHNTQLLSGTDSIMAHTSVSSDERNYHNLRQPIKKRGGSKGRPLGYPCPPRTPKIEKKSLIFQ